jgi:hypothetical protein
MTATPGSRSPARTVRIKREVVFGNPEEARISTGHVERNAFTLRMQMRRFTCLANALSRQPGTHRAAVALHAAWYNLCRVHETLRSTPAVALGVTNCIWSIADLIDAEPGMRLCRRLRPAAARCTLVPFEAGT